MTRLTERIEYGHVISTEPSNIEFYDESKVFNNSLEGSVHEGFLPSGSFHAAHSTLGPLHEHSLESQEKSQHTLPLPPLPNQPAQPTTDFPGFYNSSTQSLQHINKDLFTPSILHQAEFQASKEYFQRSLYDSSGALFAAQDAQNANLRIFPVGANTAASASTGRDRSIRDGPAVLKSAEQQQSPTGTVLRMRQFYNLVC